MRKKKNNDSIIGSVVITFILIIIFVGIIFALVKFNQKDPKDLTIPSALGGQRDAHGCLSSAGYSWCETSKKCLRTWEEVCNDSVFMTMRTIKKDTGIKFIETGPTQFVWVVKKNNQLENINIAGHKYLFTAGTDVQLQGLESWFIEHGWSADKENTATGIIGSKFGYSKDNLVCAVVAKKKDKLEETTIDTQDLTLECGILLETKAITNTVHQSVNLGIKNIFFCEKDDECIPLPNECHPLKCINKKFADQFTRPKNCTKVYAFNAVYNNSDCLCIHNLCTNKNNF